MHFVSAYILECKRLHVIVSRRASSEIVTIMPPTSSPTLNDVAKRADVSTATVSRCFNEPDRVVPETRKRVMLAVEELAYTPNFGGRVLASRKTHTVGAIIPTMENAIFARGLQAFEEALANDGFTLLVASTGYNPEREFEQIKKLVARGADGLLLIGWERSKKVFDFLKARSVPTVIAWSTRSAKGWCYSGFNNHQAAQQMAERVIAFGHKRIAMIAGVTKGNDRAADRLSGVIDALRQKRLNPDRLPVVEAQYTLEDGSRAFRELMSRKPAPTAIICGNDVLAAGALSEARRMGLKVPEDVSVTGFDDIDIATVVEPPLTTVHVPHRRMGQAAASILLNRIAGEQNASNAEFETEIVERGSLGPAR